MPDVAHKSFEFLGNFFKCLSLTISATKHFPPTTRAVCLWVAIDTTEEAIFIPDQNLAQIVTTVKEWLHKDQCTSRTPILVQTTTIHS